MLKRVLNKDLHTLLRNGLLYSSSLKTPSSNNDSIVDESKESKPEIYEKKKDSVQIEGKRKVTRKKPFKHYFDDEERDKNKIVFYEQFFDENTKRKDRDNFMVFNFFE